MKTIHRLALSGLLCIATACAAVGPADTRPIAEDIVCKYYGDLGCVRVRVDDLTPKAVYKGQTYYFCCNECLEMFHKTPEKFFENEK